MSFSTSASRFATTAIRVALVVGALAGLALLVFLAPLIPETYSWETLQHAVWLAAMITPGLVWGLTSRSTDGMYRCAWVTGIAWTTNMTVLQFVPNTLEHLLLVLLVGLPLFLTGSAFFISLGRSVGVAIAPATEGRSSALYAMIIHLFFVFLVWTTQPLIPKRQYDADLAENFRRHEAEFRQLALMADEDKYTMIIGEDTANVRSGTLSLDRLAQYRRLFGAVGMQGPMRSEGGGGLVTFSSRIEGIFEGTDRGYAHARNTRKPLVDSIDYIPFKSPSNQPVYRKLTEDWYLYYERDY